MKKSVPCKGWSYCINLTSVLVTLLILLMTLADAGGPTLFSILREVASEMGLRDICMGLFGLGPSIVVISYVTGTNERLP